MTIIFAIIKRYLISMVRNRSNWLFMLFMPLAFTFVFGVVPNMGSSTHKTPIAVVDEDKSALSKVLIGELAKDPNLKVTEVNPQATADLMREMKVSVLISIPKGFESAATHNQRITLGWTQAPNVGSTQDTQSVSAALQTSISQWVMFGESAMHAALTSGASQTQAVTAFVDGMNKAGGIHSLLSTKAENIGQNGTPTKQVAASTDSVIGFSVMFIVFAVFGSTSGILDERMKGTWKRMLASPVDKGYIVTGYGLALFLIGWIQFLVLVLASRFIMGIRVPWNGWMALIISLYVLAICGIALCVANLVKTPEQQMGIGSFVAIGSSMIGGVYWPLEIEPTWMQHVAWFVPQSWTMKAFDQVLTGLVSGAWLPLTVLAAFGVIFYVTGMIQLRYSV